MKLSLIIPIYNEQDTVARLLEKVAQVKEIHQVVIVDDGSQDDSVEEIKKFLQGLKRKDQKTADRFEFYEKENGGKGSAVRYGLERVTGDYVLIQDADLEYDPADIPSMLQFLEKEGVEVVYGSRFIGPHSNLLFWHRVGNNMLNLIVNILYNTTLSDMETCYKLVPTELLKDLDLKANSFELEPEITCKILRRGINIFEMPISYVGRGFEDGKKITWKDGFVALKQIIKLRF